MSILIVDPQIDSPLKVREVFEQYGFRQIDIARTAAEAHGLIDKCQQATSMQAITLIVVHAELDEGDGFEFCRQLRKTELGEFVYLMISISSVNNTAAIRRARQCGADDFTVTPYDGSEFFKHLAVFTHHRAVLVVDDDPTIQQLIGGLLLSMQVELMPVSDGMQAYNLINSTAPPKLVFMDIGLPNMSGLNLVKHIREKHVWRHTPIVMITASGNPDDVKASLAAGANEYIVKPFQPLDFVQRIGKYFGHGH